MGSVSHRGPDILMKLPRNTINAQLALNALADLKRRSHMQRLLSYVQIRVHTEEKESDGKSLACQPHQTIYGLAMCLQAWAELVAPCHWVAYHGFLPICLGTTSCDANSGLGASLEKLP